MPPRIKIVVSDFHLGPGRVFADGSINDVEDFVSDQAFVDLLEYYRTGEYVDADAEVVLNGDIFECLGTVDEAALGDPSMVTAAMSLAKIDRIIDGHAEMFAALRTFADDVRRTVTFVVGNHDQDLFWDEVQQRLRERIHPRVRVIADVYRFDGVHLEHGSQHEPQHRVDPQRIFLTKGLADPILNLPWGSDLFTTCMLRLKKRRPYVNKVRPFKLAVLWSVMHDFRLVLWGLWHLIVEVVRARLRRQRQRRITIWRSLRMIFGMSAYPTLEDAAARVMRGDDEIHTVIFGHTHLPLTRQIFPGRRYLNSGSWIPTSNLHIAALGRSLTQSYVLIEYEGSRPRCMLKLWHGRRMVEEDLVA